MKKFLLLLFVMLLAASATWAQTTRYVPADYSTISAAITASVDGDVIKVAPGTYYESLFINKALIIQSLSGASSTILNGNSATENYYMVDIEHNDVIFQGFTITNPIYNASADASGIVIAAGGRISNIHVLDNIIENIGTDTRTGISFGTFGINCGPVDGLEIGGNTIRNIKHGDPNDVYAMGIFTWGNDEIDNTDHINIHDNTLYDIQSPSSYDYGIATGSDGKNITVSNNTIYNIGEAGIRLSALSLAPVIVSQNNIYGTPVGIQNNSTQYPADATCNWWGTAVAADIPALVIGNVNFIPFLTSLGGACDGAPTPSTFIQTPSQVSCGVYDIPVTVQDFIGVGAISLVLNYDPLVYSYQGVTVNPLLSSSGSIETNGITAGKFKMGYFGNGVTLGSNDVLFTLHMNLVTKTSGATTNFTWSNLPGDCEYAPPSGDPVYTSNFVNGSWVVPVRPVKNINTNFEYCTIQAAIDDPATLNGHTVTVAAGMYTETININKAITLSGPNAAITGNGSRVAEAVIQFPAGAADGSSLIHAGPVLNGVTIAGFDLRCQDATIPNYHYLILTEKVDNLTIRNNRMYSSQIPIYVLTDNSMTDYRTGLLIEGNYIDCGPNVNNGYNRGMYIQATSGTIQDNQVLNTNIGIQYMPYGHTTPGLIQRNIITAGLIGLYHNFQTNGAAQVTWSQNEVSVAPNDRLGLKALLGSDRPWITEMLTFRGMDAKTFGTMGSGAAPQVYFNNNKVDGNIGSSPYYTSTIGYRTSDASATGLATLTGNSFTNLVKGAVNNSSISVAATCNWWGTNTVAGVASKISGLVVYSPWLTDGSNTGNPGFIPGGSCTGATELYVNDAVSDGNDIYTTAAGNDLLGNGTPSAPYATITKAVSMAMVGTTIKVDAGTFQEQVLIGKSLNLIGVDTTKTIVKAPTTSLTNVTWNNASPIIYASGSGNTINISKLAINGDGGRSVDEFVGMLYYEANGTFDQNKITGIHDAGVFSGNQRGYAFYGVYQDGSAQSLNITRNLIMDYQKGGIYVDGAGSNTNVLIDANVVKGQGVAHVNGQNGISPYLCNVTITNNLVINNVWNKVEHPHQWTAAGILPYETLITNVSGNTLNGNEVGLMGFNVTTPTYGVNTFNNNNIHVWLDNASQINGGNIYDKKVLNSTELPEVVFGCIQYAIDEASAADVLNASANTFIENVVVHTPVTINGSGMNSTVVLPAISAPNNCTGASLCPGTSSIFLVQASDVTIQNLTADGNNPALIGGITRGGVDIDARNGIITDHMNFPTSVFNNLNVNHVTVKNIYLRGIYASTGGTFNIHDNVISNIAGEANTIAMFNFGGAGAFTNNTVSDVNDGIASNWSTGTTYTGNVITNASTGIHTDNSGSGAGVADVIQGNSVSNGKTNAYGIFIFAPYKDVQVLDNTVTNCTYGFASAGQYTSVNPVVSGNTFDGGYLGMYLTTAVWGYTPGNQNITITNNFIKHFDYAFYLVSGAGKTCTVAAHDNSITSNGYGVATSATGSLSADMSCNWWGASSESGVVAAVGETNPPVNHTPWLINGTDNLPGTPGFQPVPLSCGGTPVVVTLNSKTDVTCLGAATGAIDINVSGGSGSYTFLWTPGGLLGEDRTGLTAGTYSVLVTDTYGSTASLTCTINTVDVTAPAISCPADAHVNQHEAKDPYATGYATATDCSGAVTITFDDNRGGLDQCNSTGVIVRTWTAKDVFNNASTCNQNIYVTDVDDPIVTVPANITVNNDPGNCTAVVAYADPKATDFGYFQGFEDPAWLSGKYLNNPSTDWNDFNSHITRVPSMTDGIPSSTGSAHAVINSTANTVPNNVSGAFCRLGGYNGAFGLGFKSKVDVYFDMTDPAISAGTYGWDLDQAVSTNTNDFLRDFVFHVGGDNTGIYACVSNNSDNGLPAWSPAYIQSHPHGIITSSGWYTMQWETRNNGGFLEVDFTILTAGGSTVWTTSMTTTDAIAGVGGNRYLWFNFIAADKLAIDNTSLVRKLAVSSSPASGSAFAKGTNTVNVTTADACGKTGSNSFTVTVLDAENPVINNCPSDITVYTGLGRTTCDAVATWSPITVSDNCTGATITGDHASGDVFPVGTTLVTYTATDASGNHATCTFHVTVVDNTVPVITGCPSSDITVYTGSGRTSCDQVATWGPITVSDNCSGAAISGDHSSGDLFPVGSTLVTYTATDANGNHSTCTFHVIVVDNTLPIITGCPSDITVNTGTGRLSCDQVATWSPITVSDNCSGATISGDHASGDVFPVGTTLVTYTATDASGNHATCTFNVIVIDNTLPIITGCPSDITVNTGTGRLSCDQVATWGTISVSDNCPNAAISGDHTSGDVFPVGSTLVTYTATDAHGNHAYCTFHVIVVDNTLPVISGCPSSDITVYTGTGRTSCDQIATWSPITVSDNCPGSSISGDHASGDLFPVGSTLVTYTATDAHGNQATCTFHVIVIDNTAPVVTCKAGSPFTRINNSGCNYVVQGAEFDASFTDNCPGGTIINDFTHTSTLAGATLSGNTTIVWTATDAHSNSSSCSIVVNVTGASISGTLRYNNTAKTTLDNVTLSITPGGTTIDTHDGGQFAFSGLCTGTYTIAVTHNGRAAGGINSTDAGAVNTYGTSGGLIEYVKFLSGDAASNDLWINSTDALKIQRNFVFGDPLDRTAWSYWKRYVTVTSNNSSKPSNFDVVINGSNVTGFEILAQVTGDFNGSYVVSPTKSVTSSLELIPGNHVQAVGGQELELPIRAASSMEVGAVSMIVTLPSDLVEVEDVKVNGSTDPVSFAVNGYELRIGWNSVNPVSVDEKGTLLTLKLKTTANFTTGQSILLTLSPDPLNELADGSYNVIEGAVLVVDEVDNGLVGIPAQPVSNGLSLENYPNPFSKATTIAYTLPVQGKVVLDLYNPLGQYVTSLVDASQSAGNYTLKFDGSRLPAGIYSAILHLTAGNTDQVRTIKLIVQK